MQISLNKNKTKGLLEYYYTFPGSCQSLMSVVASLRPLRTGAYISTWCSEIQSKRPNIKDLAWTMFKSVLAGRPMMGSQRETYEILCLAHHRRAHQDLWHRKFSEHGQPVIMLMLLLAMKQFLHFPFAPFSFLPLSNSLLPSCLLSFLGVPYTFSGLPGYPSLVVFTINFLKPLCLK